MAIVGDHIMMRCFAPHHRLNSVLELDHERLQRLGVEALLLDLDGTLKDYPAEEVPAAVVQWIQRLQADGLRLCLLSNGKHRRIAGFAEVLGIPFVAKAFKPLPFGCRKALRLLKVDRTRAAIIGDQLFADVLAGRLAGLITFLVPPTHALADEPWFTRIKRPLERWVLRGWHENQHEIAL